ncbi:hypothetical protein [Bacteroides xylanisolvens]|uniref:hypothetical protein n=1 Tax=Bacteroides xylanisolvens TaxID=371601 RepID=UPI001F5A2E83|nr:hypothetical protein [Bacteroides xylanisolvens]
MKLLFLIFCIFTISCSNEDKLNCEPIELSSNSIHILAGEKRIVYILSDLEKFQMGLGLQSENPRIATVEPQNDSKAILITGNSVGNTSIYLRDLRNPDNFAEIEVISDYLSGKFIEKGDSSSTWINGGDLHIREIIESELKEIAKNRTGILYSFDKDTKAVEIDYSSSDYDNNKKAGTYEWDKDSLTLNFNNNISKHGFAVVNDHTIIIVLDFTEKYKSKYPNASVKGAKIQYFLSAIE